MLFFSLCGTAGAETHIAGDISKISFDRSASPYVVDRDITVPAGTTATINQGCALLFNQFCGIQVQGCLKVLGTSSDPVVFSSINDVEVNPASRQLANPFDWNGILLARESKGSVLQNFALRYSVYGIKAQTEDLAIQNGLFRQNGQFHFTINEKIQYVQDNIPFSYGMATIESPQPAGANSGKMPAATGKKKGADASSGKGKRMLRIGGLGVGIGGVTIGTGLLIPAAIVYGNLQKNINDWNAARLKATSDPELKAIDSIYRSKADKNAANYNGLLISGIILESLGALGLIGFGISFAF